MLHRVLPRRSNRMASRFGCSSANIAFSVVAIVWIASSGIALLPARPAQVADQACVAAAPTDASSGDSGLNWGSVPDGAVNPACDPLQSADEASSNWGQVPKEDSVVVVQIGGDNVVSIPEVLAESEGEMGGTGGSCSAPTTGLDASWDDVNRWDSAVDTAAQQVLQETGVQVPRNVVKSVMKIESGGNPAAGPAYGLLQVTAGAIGSYDLNRAASDPGYGIYAGVKELAFRYIDSGKLPWENVAVGYFSGHYVPNGAADSFSTDFEYQNRFKDFFNQLELVQPEGRACSTGSAVGVASIWGNKLFDGGAPPLSQGFGPTDFSRYVHPEWYSYALAYGFTEPGHTGLDVAIPAGTPLYAPMDATIICAGTNNGTGEDSCAAFLSAYGGPTSGRLQLKLPNDDMLILGHVNESLVTPGQQVKPGQQVGISGGFNGDHVHVEYRVKDASTSSGWRIVDPRQPLDGVKVDTFETPTSGQPMQPTVMLPTPTPTSNPTVEASPTSNPTVEVSSMPDFDGDGLSDMDEANVYGTDINVPDTDNDGLSDGDEVMTYGSNPLMTDSDNDGLSDGDEVNTYGSSPVSVDTDSDGLPDYNEALQHGTDPAVADSDSDGVNDHDEVSAGTNPNDPASFTAGSSASDTDGDGLNNDDETSYLADPNIADTDADGLIDGEEVHTYQTNPAIADSDGDGLFDRDELFTYSTNPLDFDSDDDGVSDGQEISNGTDPLNQSSF